MNKDPRRNYEGYWDSTAFAAIQAADRALRAKRRQEKPLKRKRPKTQYRGGILTWHMPGIPNMEV